MRILFADDVVDVAVQALHVSEDVFVGVPAETVHKGVDVQEAESGKEADFLVVENFA